MTQYYMACLDLTGRRCVVVGGGTVGAEKAADLIACGAAVTVVSPTLDPSLHAAPVTNLPPGTALPRLRGERAVAFAEPPGEAAYLEEVRASVRELSAGAAALVVSLGFDTVAGDPHGGWEFGPGIFAAIGGLLTDSELPVCVVQEGGYALRRLAACSHAFALGLLGGGAA